MTNPERNFETNPDPLEQSIHSLYKELKPLRDQLTQSFNSPPKEIIETGVEIAIASAQAYAESSIFKDELKEFKLAFPTIDPLELAIDSVEFYISGLIVSGAEELQKKDNPYDFIQAMDITQGALAIISGLELGYTYKDDSDENIRNTVIRSSEELPDHIYPTNSGLQLMGVFGNFL